MEHSGWKLYNKQYEESLMEYEDFQAVILRVINEQVSDTNRPKKGRNM